MYVSKIQQFSLSGRTKEGMDNERYEKNLDMKKNTVKEHRFFKIKKFIKKKTKKYRGKANKHKKLRKNLFVGKRQKSEQNEDIKEEIPIHSPLMICAEKKDPHSLMVRRHYNLSLNISFTA